MKCRSMIDFAGWEVTNHVLGSGTFWRFYSSVMCVNLACNVHDDKNVKLGLVELISETARYRPSALSRKQPVRTKTAGASRLMLGPAPAGVRRGSPAHVGAGAGPCSGARGRSQAGRGEWTPLPVAAAVPASMARPHVLSGDGA